MTFKERFEKEIAPSLQKDLKIGNLLGVPRPVKIVINMGLGRAKGDEGYLNESQEELARIAGQRPNVRRARKSEAGWGLRQGDVIGLAVTLRKERLWHFLERLVKIALPRVRDFQGLSRKALDGHGNYTIGISEHTAFPEVDPDNVNILKGLEVIIVTSAADDEHGYQLLKALGVPFKD